MKVGELYVWPGCFRIDRETGQVTGYLMSFHYSANGGLWPKPVLGVNVSKMPEGEGVPTSYVHHMFAVAKTN
jgi:hypothetical protein